MKSTSQEQETNLGGSDAGQSKKKSLVAMTGLAVALSLSATLTADQSTITLASKAQCLEGSLAELQEELDRRGEASQ